MARPKSDQKRSAILAAAIRVIAAQGLAAPTATIAKAAGVSNGSLFTYFETKAELLNQLYIELKTEMADATLKEVPVEGEAREQMRRAWNGWLQWATSDPEKRRTLRYLAVSDDITRDTHQAIARSQGRIVALLERSRANGPMREAPLLFVASLMNAVAEATIDFIDRDPANAESHTAAGFDAMWRVVA